MKQLLIETIRIDGTQSRAAIDQATVAEYVEAIRAGAKMPPIIVYHDGTDNWLADGFHRFHAHLGAEKRNILAEVKKGGKEDAAWASAGANLTHGLRRTNDDKRKATMMALTLRPDLSDEALALHCGVSHTFVGQMRRQVATVATSKDEKPNKTAISAPPTRRTGVDGKSYPVRPSSPPTLPPPPSRPPAPRPGPKTGQVDETGHPIPDHLLPLWERRGEVESVLTHLSEVRVAIDRAQEAGDPLFAELNTSAAMANLNTTYDMIKATKPHAVCPWCHGTLSDQCRACRGRGMIGSFSWGRAPKKLKKGRD